MEYKDSVMVKGRKKGMKGEKEKTKYHMRMNEDNNDVREATTRKAKQSPDVGHKTIVKGKMFRFEKWERERERKKEKSLTNIKKHECCARTKKEEKRDNEKR